MTEPNTINSDLLMEYEPLSDEEVAAFKAAADPKVEIAEYFGAASFHADQLAARLHVAAWCAKDIHDDPHPRRVFDALQRTASALGYDLVRKSDEVAA